MVSIARDGEWGSATLTRAVEQLRLYKAAELLIDDQIAPKRAAVLICLFEAAGEIRVILTKRAVSLSTHSGEVALPGGKRDESDANDAATAVREAYEEIGLEPASIQVVASLEPFLSKGDPGRGHPTRRTELRSLLQPSGGGVPVRCAAGNVPPGREASIGAAQPVWRELHATLLRARVPGQQVRHLGAHRRHPHPRGVHRLPKASRIRGVLSRL
ncbi:nudix hydrolase 22, chloroplastic isoform X2 [Selaginella moellendorffii]|uniref:nudix hydrolase 22, chloroplastic isoform X2 n=1 Tax=Selaginella moellendorffii TaxID=88036 RepID=UPI000D1C67E0|nr:nudix hydrolase 22, chloroplastic isoform X2 [Selaginella moellendorffii]|eukprot:XP_024521645.1 nudix hydrolase 22, chloroplastic isoform X2 [Selaginella moellendorffii]